MPGIVLSTVDGRIYPYPEERNFNISSVHSWIVDLFFGKIKDFPKDGDDLMIDAEITPMLLNSTYKANLFTYKPLVLPSEIDALVLLYSTARLTNL